MLLTKIRNLLRRGQYNLYQIRGFGLVKLVGSLVDHLGFRWQTSAASPYHLGSREVLRRPIPRLYTFLVKVITQELVVSVAYNSFGTLSHFLPVLWPKLIRELTNVHQVLLPYFVLAIPLRHVIVRLPLLQSLEHFLVFKSDLVELVTSFFPVQGLFPNWWQILGRCIWHSW